MSEWISVKKNVPTSFDPVLAFITNSFQKKKNDILIEQIIPARFCYCKGWDIQENQLTRRFYIFEKDGKKIDHFCKYRFDGDCEVTHWMPLPEAPNDHG